MRIISILQLASYIDGCRTGKHWKLLRNFRSKWHPICFHFCNKYWISDSASVQCTCHKRIKRCADGKFCCLSAIAIILFSPNKKEHRSGTRTTPYSIYAILVRTPQTIFFGYQSEPCMYCGNRDNVRILIGLKTLQQYEILQIAQSGIHKLKFKE